MSVNGKDVIRSKFSDLVEQLKADASSYNKLLYHLWSLPHPLITDCQRDDVLYKPNDIPEDTALKIRRFLQTLMKSRKPDWFTQFCDGLSKVKLSGVLSLIQPPQSETDGHPESVAKNPLSTRQPRPETPREKARKKYLVCDILRMRWLMLILRLLPRF